MFYVTVFSIYYVQVVVGVVYVEKHFITISTKRKYRRREHIVNVETATQPARIDTYAHCAQCNFMANQLIWFNVKVED